MHAGAQGEAQVYDSYDPLALAQHADGHVQEFATFDAAVDEFYSKVGTALHYVEFT